MGFAGGFTLGVVQSGFKLVGKRELKGGFGVPNCEVNRHLLGSDWTTEVGESTTWSVPTGGVDFVFGNPPCSGFSVMSNSAFRGADSPVNHCMWSFAEYVTRAKPQIAIFESVAAARTRPDGHALMRNLRSFVEARTDASWDLYHVRHNARALGGAAERPRYFWVVSRIPFGVEVPRLRRVPVLNDIFADLDTLQNTWLPQPYRQPPTWWSAARRASEGTVDGMVSSSSPLVRRIHALLEENDWRPGEAIASVVRRHYERESRLPDNWTHLTDKLVGSGFNMGFTTPVRWNGERAARVITGAALETVVHPTLPRTLTHREAARVMGFPDDWRILPLRGLPAVASTWGKGITVDCGRWIGSWVSSALSGQPGTQRGEQIGDGEWDINLTHAHKKLT